MTRSVNEPTRIVFERKEIDGKSHAPWVFAVTLQADGAHTVVAVSLDYQGKLWTGGLLDKVLRDHVAVAKERLPRVCV